MREPNATIAAWADHVPAGVRVLDVAAGGGRHAQLFGARGCAVTAVDRDVAALRALAAPSLEILEADLENAPWPLPDRRFDAIVVVDYLWRPLLPTLAASLAPGGLLLYETFAAGNERFGRPRNPEFLLHDGELCDFAATHGLEVLDYRSGAVGEPPRAVRQRLLARRPLTDRDAARCADL
ncbi:MAG: class I SAM-dependent methyltransferase [Planctomycetes bacterium]|nr:class I SAM-dependent methyltransferase [Planctomycetota bacterium]